MCCIKKITVFLFGLLFIPTAFSQINVIPDSLASIQDTDSLHILRKNGVKAATYVFATNIRSGHSIVLSSTEALPAST